MLTQEQQRAMAVHVQYEVDESRASLRDLPRLQGRHFERNRALESVLLHFRNLRDFFLPEPQPSNDDVTAQDYVTAWNPAKDPIFNATRTRINKLLAHLTRERLTRRSEWPELEQMNNAIEKLLGEFAKLLSHEQASWFPRLENPQHRIVLGSADNSTLS